MNLEKIDKHSSATDFIKAIKTLDEKSTKEDIEKLLFYDMKQEANYEIVNNEDNQIKLDYLPTDKITEKNKIEYLKNWLRYKVLISIIKFDSDTTDKTKAFLKAYLEEKLQKQIKEITLDCENKKLQSNRTFQITTTNLEKIYLDTDTMNSYATTFNGQKGITNGFINSLRKKCSNFFKKYPNRLTYLELLSEIDNIYEAYKNNYSNSDLFDKFITFAKLQNTIGNYVLVPKGYNAGYYYENIKRNIGRATATSDYWDLTMEDLKSLSAKENNYNYLIRGNKKIELNNIEKANFKWYCENKEAFLIEVEKYIGKELFYGGHNSNNRIPNLEQMDECVKSINKFIVNRGLEMMCTINKKIINNRNIEIIKNEYI